MTEPTESKVRRKTSVYTRPADLMSSTLSPGDHPDGSSGLQAASLTEGGRSRKVSFGSTGRPRNTSVGSTEGVGGQDAGNYRGRKISVSRRNLTVEDTSSTVRGMSATQARPNTYKMNPDKPFGERAVREVIENVLSGMDSLRYDSPVLMSGKASTLCDAVKQGVKQLGFDRYKLVCVVCLGQKNGQQVQDVGRCLWDPTKDCFVSVSYENATLFVVVSVYAIYQE